MYIWFGGILKKFLGNFFKLGYEIVCDIPEYRQIH